MSILFDKIIFGPVHSRRFGISLGVNLLPVNHKICSFDCIYCECGWTETSELSQIVPRAMVREALQHKLEELKKEGVTPDNITWAGNGEPTLHPEFSGIVEDVIALRDQYFPNAKTTVLSNSTTLFREDVFQALQQVDNNVMKLDAGTVEMYQAINQCKTERTLDQITQDLCRFNGNLTLQTLFLRGSNRGISIDNTTETEFNAWLKRVEKIRPRLVMLYAIDRATPAEHLIRLDKTALSKMAESVENIGIKTQIYE